MAGQRAAGRRGAWCTRTEGRGLRTWRAGEEGEGVEEMKGTRQKEEGGTSERS